MIKIPMPTTGDVNAGVLVALVGIPQCLAYAMLSGLPPMYGLVTAAIPGIVAALLGRSAHVTVGPTNTTGLVILTSLAPWAGQPEQLLTAMATLTVMAGLARLAIVAFKAERIFDFVPEAVMLGFSTGAALIIALMQLDEFLGVPFADIRNVVDEISRLANLDPTTIRPASIALAVVALLSVVLGRRYAPRWPIPLLTLIASVALVWSDLGGLGTAWITLGASTTISDGWPLLASRLPSWAMVQALVIPGFAVAFIGSLELIVTLRNRGEQRWLSPELRSQGVANLVGSVVGSFPASTSLTRSVLLDLGGASSRWAPLIAGVVLLPIIWFGAEMIRAIPQPVIAGLLVATAISMLKPKAIRSMLGAGNETRTLFVVTTAATLIISFHEAILLGAGIGIAMFLMQTSQPQIRCLELAADGWLVDKPGETCNCFVLQVSGDLYFAAARQLPERLDAALPSRAKQVTIDLNNAHHARVAAVQALQRFVALARARDVEVRICGHTASLARLAGVLGIGLPWLDARVAEQLVVNEAEEPAA
ncbi:SulP family inorganic anion transporter [Piscinibacter sakaiensis]|uniref:SulP family inorganic anion transporter n=1 Tax=Piscinibacter sakaiensis TaxID=1547922 RepID=UPI003AAE96FA